MTRKTIDRYQLKQRATGKAALANHDKFLEIVYILIDTPEQKGRITTKGPYRAGEGARIR